MGSGPSQIRDGNQAVEHQTGMEADWQSLLGVDATLPIVEGVGRTEVPVLASVSRHVNEASSAAAAVIRQKKPFESAVEEPCAITKHTLFRLNETYSASVPSKLNALKGSVVSVWEGTETETGWVYAEE